MNRLPTPPQTATGHDGRQARFALQVAAHLEAGSRDLPAQVRERLQAARERAIQALPSPQASTVVNATFQTADGQISFGRDGDPDIGGRPPMWQRFASVFPLLLLVIGFASIQYLDRQDAIQAAAEVDAQLLSDELPPEAYADPGFEAFLKGAPPR